MKSHRADLEIPRSTTQLRAFRRQYLRKLRALIWSELLARKWWFAFAGILGVLPLLGFFIPMTDHHPLVVVAAAVAILTAIGSALFALVAGLTLNWRELAEHRRGFFLVKPLSGRLLWEGKFLSGVGLVILLTLITALPGVLVVGTALSWPGLSIHNDAPEIGPSTPVDPASPREAIEFIDKVPRYALIAAPVFPLAFWLGIALGTRTHWLGLDFVLLLFFGLLTWWNFSRFSALGFEEGARSSAVTVAVVAWLAFIAAGAASLARGRLGPERMHRFLSLMLWPLLATGLAGQSLYSAWYSHPQLDTLEQIKVDGAAPAGSWIRVSGVAKHRHGNRAYFLVNSATGANIDLGLRGRYSYPLVSFSADGRTAAWIESKSNRGSNPQGILSIARLEESRGETTRRRIGADGLPHLSPEGGYCVIATSWANYDSTTNSYIWGGGSQPVFRIQNGVLHYLFDLTKVVDGPCASPGFLDETTLRCHPLKVSRTNKIFEIDLLDKAKSVVGLIPDEILSDYGLYSLSPSGSLLARAIKDPDSEDFELVVIDAKNGEESRRVALETSAWPSVSWFHTDDRLAVSSGDGHKVTIFDMDEEILSTVDLGDHRHTGFVQVNESTLLFGKGKTSLTYGVVHPFLRLYALDISSARVHELDQALVPALPLGMGSWESSRIFSSPDSPGSKIFFDREGDLVFFDYNSGERRTVLEIGHEPGEE